MLESLNLYAGVASVLLPLAGGTWLFVKAGRSATSAVSGGMWMAFFSLIPIILFWIIAAGVEELIGFNIFPAAPVVVVMFFTLIAQPDGEKVWSRLVFPVLYAAVVASTIYYWAIAPAFK
jgi:hypothetical protein